MSDDNHVTLRCMEVFGGNRTTATRVSLPGLHVYVRSKAFESDAGGDMHYLSTCGRGEILRVILADVSGHGAEVSGIAEQVRRLVVKHVNRPDQARMMQRLNKALLGRLRQGQFVTGIFATWYRSSGHLVLGNAGHLRPLIWRAQTGQWGHVDRLQLPATESSDDVPLGILDQPTFTTTPVRLFAGDIVVLYTDGVCDDRQTSGASGEARLYELARRIRPADPEHCIEALYAELGRENLCSTGVDDETLIAFSPSAAPPTPLTLKDRLHAMARMLPLSSAKADRGPESS